MQVDEKMIPPEVVEAAARRLAQITHQNLTLIRPLAVAEHEFVETQWCSFALHARAAIAAGIAAWPRSWFYGDGFMPPLDTNSIILPLPQEPST